MAGKGNCADFVIDAGKALFLPGAAPDVVDRQMLDLFGSSTAPPRSTTLFVSAADVQNPDVRDFLRRELDKDLHPTVTIFDPQRSTLVDDFAVLDAARGSLDADINLPPTMKVPDAVAGDVVQVDDSLRRLAPVSTIEQRQALRTLADDSAPAGPDKLARYLEQGPPGLTDGSGPVADHSAMLGVPHALFGDRPGLDLPALLSSPGRVSLADVRRALDGQPTALAPSTVVNELESGRASAALVHGWPPGATEPQTRWLYRDHDGAVRWGIEGTPKFNRDGSTDPRTRLLEQPQTTALLLGPDGAAIVPPDAPAVAFEPVPSDLHLSVRSRASGNSILLGPWDDDFVGPNQRQIRQVAESLDQLNVPLNVRRGEPREGLSTVESAIADALHMTLENNRDIRVVVATEANDQLTWLATQRHQRSSVHPVDEGWKRLWVATGPDGRSDRYSDPLDALRRATTLADPLPDTTMPEVRALLASGTWKDAQAFFRDHIDRLRTPDAVDEVVRMVRQNTELSLRGDRLGDGLIRDSPFFVPDVITPAFAMVLKTAVNAGGDAMPSIEPRKPWLLDEIGPHTQRADENLLFGYLTDRPLNLSSPVGEYMTGLLWLREMVQAMLSAATGITPQDGLSVIRAKGELDGERAARTPGQPEQLRAHAVIAENFMGILFPDQASHSEAERLLDAIDCLTGEDRVAWYYMIKHMAKPFRPAEQDVNRLRDRISNCAQ
ncbi:hypothetical protein [Micromonospora sp. LOL_023]|uniref:hypothetical protein n=1 Tax=Micromonospora sp. LOL_023 TaxID=3345418 RepID=UPI003A89C8AE